MCLFVFYKDIASLELATEQAAEEIYYYGKWGHLPTLLMVENPDRGYWRKIP